MGIPYDDFIVDSQTGTEKQVTDSKIHVSVVIPAFNEELVITTAATEALEDLRSAGMEEYELVLVDDGSSDGTGEAMRRVAAENSRVRVEKHVKNRGLGAAIRTGLEASRGEFLMWVPGDAQFKLAPLLAALPLMAQTDMIVGLRPARKPKEIIRRTVTWCLRSFTRLLFKLDATDYCGLYIFRRTDLTKIAGKTDNVFFNVEVLLNAGKAGLKVTTIFTPSHPRVAGHSKVMNVRVIAKNTWDMLMYRLRN